MRALLTRVIYGVSIGYVLAFLLLTANYALSISVNTNCYPAVMGWHNAEGWEAALKFIDARGFTTWFCSVFYPMRYLSILYGVFLAIAIVICAIITRKQRVPQRVRFYLLFSLFPFTMLTEALIPSLSSGLAPRSAFTGNPITLGVVYVAGPLLISLMLARFLKLAFGNSSANANG